MNRIEVLDELINDEKEIMEAMDGEGVAYAESKARLSQLEDLKLSILEQEEKKKDKVLNYVVEIMKVLIPSAVSIAVMLNQNKRMEKAIRFEQTGSFTTTATKAVARDIFKN